ncbi:MAG TPA: DUF3060 domain-containing protein [Alcaligenes sp.]|nr:DUF3060 domain-containing protein [Alcaligenes sp.]HRL26133.1 DUF3060 domain-containing protein [Alcaligenes sp.]
MRHTPLFLVSLMLLYTTPAAAQASSIQIQGSDQTQTITCQGDILLIAGERNTAAVQGHCAEIRVEGADNNLSFGHADRLTVKGPRQRIRGGTTQTLDLSGNANTLELALGRSTGPAKAHLKGANNHISVRLTSPADITLEGADNTVRWQGTAGAADPVITLRGARNRIVQD